MKKRGAQLQLEIEEYLARPMPIAVASSPPAPESRLVAPAADELRERVAAYETKVEAKRDRLEAAAARARGEAASRHGTARRIGAGIPFGQPILVGHHSEKRHRRDVAKIDTNMRKAVEASKHAAELASRAASVGTGGISSDDPVAVQKLKAELAKLERDQERMKAGNALIRKHAKVGPEAQVAALIGYGFGEKLARDAITKDFAGRIGFPAYAISNNAANMRRIEKRIAELTARETAAPRETIYGALEGVGFTIEENRAANRVQIVFPGKPSEAVRARLKAAGFRWAPSEGAWQRQLSSGAWYHAQRAMGLAVRP